jgi:hypothetical protein
MSSPRPRCSVSCLYPRGTYKAPPFYFRGSEELTEPEYVAQQLEVAQCEYAKSLRDLERERAEFEETSALLEDQDDYAITIANYLGEKPATAELHSELCRQLADLTSGIESLDFRISVCRSQRGTHLLSALERERAIYHIEIENMRHEAAVRTQSLQAARLDLYDVVSSRDYYPAVQRVADLAAMSQLCSQLRAQTNAMFQEFHGSHLKKTIVRGKDADGAVGRIRALCDERQSRALRIDRLRHELFFSEAIARAKALAMIDQIGEMNRLHVDLGGPEIDVSDIRAHFTDDRERPATDRKKRIKVTAGRRQTPLADESWLLSLAKSVD